uniref:Uncharacterized protein n=1 Tax=Arundo donax TaxID=35708 RepID=A0A0A8XW35_ARUDO
MGADGGIAPCPRDEGTEIRGTATNDNGVASLLPVLGLSRCLLKMGFAHLATTACILPGVGTSELSPDWLQPPIARGRGYFEGSFGSGGLEVGGLSEEIGAMPSVVLFGSSLAVA